MAKDTTRREWMTRAGATALTAGGLALLPRIVQAKKPKGPVGTGPKILIMGDSMISGSVGVYAERDLRDAHHYPVHRRGKSSTGLARPDFFDWIKEGGKLFEREKPDATVFMVGGNDGQGLWMGYDKKRKKSLWIRYGEPDWTDEYRRRVNAFADAVAPDGQHIFWIGMPQMRLTKLHARVEHMNTIYRAEMAVRPNAHFVDIWRTLANDEGKYSDHLKVDGKKTRVRAGDGVHLNGAGARLVVDQLVPMIVSAMGPAQMPANEALEAADAAPASVDTQDAPA